ncbi:lysophosphatidylcholine acyltransferase 1 isoform X3 [Tachysurus fulvidraco]|uniref:lysophosphatidylcholine acyltransferase 1 isoform X3 n=1 Tax=Tachysurus fulvidraco TaxID=1234273 RepID=UPI001FEE641C|nr:lysophosphatidylcholine acyltransferase 1 isoform X3 [Tachysurus fulvidraco]
MRLVHRKRTPAGNREDFRVSTHFTNPFTHELKLSPVQKVQIALMTVTLFPLRLLCCAFFMLLAWPFVFLATMGRTDAAVEPLTWWRWLLELIIKGIMRAMWFSGGFHWIRVKGRLALPSEAPILILAPHTSYFDGIPVTMTMSSIVMKSESKDVPVWGTLIKFIRPVLVSRSDPDSRRKTLEEIKRRACSAGQWPQIMIFPEGTCTNRTCLITFKPGAFIPGVPVQPVVLRYLNKLDTMSWTWRGPGAFTLLWLTLCQIHNPVEVEYLPVYTPSEEEKKDPTLFASNVRNIMAKALQLPTAEYSFEDGQLSVIKGPLSLPGHTGLLEFSRLVHKLGLKVGVTDELLQEEGKKACNLSGRKLSLEDFTEYLKLPLTETLQDIFTLFEEHGQMDVREYVIALSVICRPSKSLKTLQLAFRMFEAEDDGAIVEDELAVILKSVLGVEDVAVGDVFRAVDTRDKGKITFDAFCHFMERCPNFMKLYRCIDEPTTHTSSGLVQPATNSFCPDSSSQEQNNTTHIKKQD